MNSKLIPHQVDINQHYLPQFLLKKFRSRGTGKKCYTFVFMKSHSPFETNVRNIGSERLYYSLGDDHSADAYMKNKEKHYEKILTSIEHNKNITEDIIHDLIKFSIHIAHRSKYLREILQNTSNSALSCMSEKITSKDSKIVKRVHRRIDDKTAELATIANKLRRSPYNKELLKQIIAKKQTECKKKFEEIYPTVANDFSDVLRKVENRIPSLVKTEHIHAIKEDTFINNYFDEIKSLNWSIDFSIKNNFILGDIGPITINNDNKFLPLVFTKMSIKAFFMPLGCHAMLCGSREAYTVNAHDLNVETANLCNDYFISSTKDEKTSTYHQHIGRDLKSTIGNTIESIYRKLYD